MVLKPVGGAIGRGRPPECPHSKTVCLGGGSPQRGVWGAEALQDKAGGLGGRQHPRSHPSSAPPTPPEKSLTLGISFQTLPKRWPIGPVYHGTLSTGDPCSGDRLDWLWPWHTPSVPAASCRTPRHGTDGVCQGHSQSNLSPEQGSPGLWTPFHHP